MDQVTPETVLKPDDMAISAMCCRFVSLKQPRQWIQNLQSTVLKENSTGVKFLETLNNEFSDLEFGGQEYIAIHSRIYNTINSPLL